MSHLNFVKFEDRIFNLDRIEYFFVGGDHEVRAKFIGVDQSVFVIRLGSYEEVDKVFWQIRQPEK